MKHCTVFDPDDESGYTYRWHGGVTVNIYCDIGEDQPTEVDVFTMGWDYTFPPPLEEVEKAVKRHHEAALGTEEFLAEHGHPASWE